jgi:small subunit ribosomal protein S21
MARRPVTSERAREFDRKECFSRMLLCGDVQSPQQLLRREQLMQVMVRDNNVDQALRVLKKKMQREGIYRELKRRRHYEKPSERRVREKTEAVNRARKLARKKLQREGLLPKKPRSSTGTAAGRGPARPAPF